MTLRGKASTVRSKNERRREGGREKRKKGEKKSDENLGNSHFPASDEALFARGGVVANGYSSRGGRKYEGIPPR